MRVQATDEPVEAFITDLHRMSEHCSYCYICVYLTLYLRQFIYLGKNLYLEDNNEEHYLRHIYLMLT